MKNDKFSERLNLLLDKEGFPPKNRGRIQLLAEIMGLTHRGASKWVNGESCPPLKKYVILAQKFNVDENWLRTGEGKMRPENILISNYGEAASYNISVDVYSLDRLFAEKPLQTLPCVLPHQGNFFGVVLDSESMSPRFPKDTIIILENATAKDGDFILVQHPSFPFPIFRQLIIVGNKFYLTAHNPKFERLILTNKKQIIGRLVQAILTFC